MAIKNYPQLTHPHGLSILENQEELARVFLPDSLRSALNLTALPLLPSLGAIAFYGVVCAEATGGVGGVMVVLFLTLVGMLAQFFAASQVNALAPKLSRSQSVHMLVAIVAMALPYSLAFRGVFATLGSAAIAVLIEVVFLKLLFLKLR